MGAPKKKDATKRVAKAAKNQTRKPRIFKAPADSIDTKALFDAFLALLGGYVASRALQPKAGGPAGARDCCALFEAFFAAPSGTLLTIEDGVPLLIPPPAVTSYLRWDQAGSGFPYWEPE